MTELLFEKVRNEILLPKLHGGPDQDALDALRSLEEQLEAAQRLLEEGRAAVGRAGFKPPSELSGWCAAVTALLADPNPAREPMTASEWVAAGMPQRGEPGGEAVDPATSFPGGVAQPSVSATVGQSAGLESQRTEKAESAPPAGESHPAKKFTPAEIGHMQDAIDQHNPGNYERRTASPPAKAPLTEAAEGSGLTSGNWAKEPHNCPEDCQGIHDAFDANDWD